MKRNQGSQLRNGITFSYNLSKSRNNSFESNRNEAANCQKANLANLNNKLTYLNKRDGILKKYKHEYSKIINPELARILMIYYSEDNGDKRELKKLLKKYKANVQKDSLSNKLKVTSVYENNSLNDKDKHLLEQLNVKLIAELNNLLKVSSTGSENIIKDCKWTNNKLWIKRIPPYDCDEKLFVPLHNGEDIGRHSIFSEVTGDLNTSLSWNNKSVKGEGSSEFDYESKALVGIRLNNKPGRLKAIVRLKCTDYSFGYSSYLKDCVASSFYSNIRNEIMFRVNFDNENSEIINCQSSDINSDPAKIGCFTEYYNEGDEMIFGFESKKVIPTNSILWIGLRNRMFSFYQNLEAEFFQRVCLRVEEVRWLIKS